MLDPVPTKPTTPQWQSNPSDSLLPVLGDGSNVPLGLWLILFQAWVVLTGGSFLAGFIVAGGARDTSGMLVVLAMMACGIVGLTFIVQRRYWLVALATMALAALWLRNRPLMVMPLLWFLYWMRSTHVKTVFRAPR